MMVIVCFIVAIVLFLIHGGYKYRTALDVTGYDLAFAATVLGLLLWYTHH